MLAALDHVDHVLSRSGLSFGSRATGSAVLVQSVQSLTAVQHWLHPQQKLHRCTGQRSQYSWSLMSACHDRSVVHGSSASWPVTSIWCDLSIWLHMKIDAIWTGLKIYCMRASSIARLLAEQVQTHHLQLWCQMIVTIWTKASWWAAYYIAYRATLGLIRWNSLAVNAISLNMHAQPKTLIYCIIS